MKLFSFSSVAYLFSIDRCSDGMGWIFLYGSRRGSER